MNTTYLPEKDKQLIELNAVIKFHSSELLNRLIALHPYIVGDVGGVGARAYQAALNHTNEIITKAGEIYDAI